MSIERIWDDAVGAHEGEPCRVCGWHLDDPLGPLRSNGRRIELAHVLPREHDVVLTTTGGLGRRRRRVMYVDPLGVVPLCGPATDTGTCHNAYDTHQLDLWPHLTPEERNHAVSMAGHPGRAMRLIRGRDHTNQPQEEPTP